MELAGPQAHVRPLGSSAALEPESQQSGTGAPPSWTSAETSEDVSLIRGLPPATRRVLPLRSSDPGQRRVKVEFPYLLGRPHCRSKMSKPTSRLYTNDARMLYGP